MENPKEYAKKHNLTLWITNGCLSKFRQLLADNFTITEGKDDTTFILEEKPKDTEKLVGE